MNRVLVSNLQSRARFPERRVRRLLRLALAAQGVRACEVSVVLADDRAMRRLNRRYFGKDRPTDVIAFRAADSRGGRSEVLGDVIVSVDTARRAARELGIGWREELCRYLIHGLLHLLGYEDTSRRGYRRMHRLQEELLKKYAPAISR